MVDEFLFVVTDKLPLGSVIAFKQNPVHLTHLVLEEQSFERPVRPVIHGVGQKFHSDGIHSKEITYEDHLKCERSKLITGCNFSKKNLVRS